jgi:hypothetical protein
MSGPDMMQKCRDIVSEYELSLLKGWSYGIKGDASMCFRRRTADGPLSIRMWHRAGGGDYAWKPDCDCSDINAEIESFSGFELLEAIAIADEWASRYGGWETLPIGTIWESAQ